jgi:hypothetical protein
MQESALWPNIRLDDEYSHGQDTAVLLATYLHLSQARNLNITFVLRLASWDSIRDRITEHRSRIKTIVFAQASFIPELWDKANSILKYLSPMSNLIEVQGFSTDVHWLLEQGTQLVDVRPTILSAETLSLPNARYIRHIRTVEKLRVILTLAKNLPWVETVELHNDFATLNHSSTVIEPKDIGPDLPELLSWTSLLYDQSFCKFPLWLLDRLPRLIYLEITLDCAQIGPFMEYFSRLLCLKAMFIKLEFGQANSITLPSTIPPCPCLDSISIFGIGAPRFDISIDIQRLYKLLAKAAVNVRTLTLNNTAISSSYLLLKTDGFQALETLFLSVYRSDHLLEGGLTWFPPSLRRLHISLPNLKASQAYCSTLEELVMPDVFDPYEDLSMMAWPRLKFFEIKGDRLKWRNITHQNLRDRFWRKSHY